MSAIRYPVPSGEPLVRNYEAAVAAIAEREAKLVPGLTVSFSEAGTLVIQGDHEAIAALLVRFEKLGLYAPADIQVAGDADAAQTITNDLLDMTDHIAVCCRPAS